MQSSERCLSDYNDESKEITERENSIWPVHISCRCRSLRTETGPIPRGCHSGVDGQDTAPHRATKGKFHRRVLSNLPATWATRTIVAGLRRKEPGTRFDSRSRLPPIHNVMRSLRPRKSYIWFTCANGIINRCHTAKWNLIYPGQAGLDVTRTAVCRRWRNVSWNPTWRRKP